MFQVQNIFHAKPGKAKELVAIFKNASQYLADYGVMNTRILTDVAAPFWTVVIQSEVEDLNTYFDMSNRVSQKPELRDAMKGYMDLVESGRREVYRIES